MSDPRRRGAILVLAALLPLAVALAVTQGVAPLPLGGVLRAVAARAGLGGAPLPEPGETILFAVRIPRALLAALVGGGLAAYGAACFAVGLVRPGDLRRLRRRPPA